MAGRPPSPGALVWRAADRQRFAFRSWPDEATGCAYDLLAGHTHALSAFSMELLDLLADGPRDETALIDDLRDIFDDLALAGERIRNELAQLRRIGLVEPLNGPL